MTLETNRKLCKNFFTCEKLDMIQKSDIAVKEVVKSFKKACAKCADYKEGNI